MRRICGYILLLVLIVHITSLPPDGPPIPKRYPIQDVIAALFPDIQHSIYVHLSTVVKEPVIKKTRNTKSSKFVTYADLNEVKFFVLIFLEYNSTKFKVPVMVESGAGTLISPHFIVTANQTTPFFKFFPAYKYTALAQPFDLDYTYFYKKATENPNYRWIKWRLQAIRGFQAFTFTLLQVEEPFFMGYPYREFEVYNWESLAFTKNRTGMDEWTFRGWSYDTFYRVPALEPNLEKVYKFSTSIVEDYYKNVKLETLTKYLYFDDAVNNYSQKLCNRMLGAPLLTRGNVVGVLGAMDPVTFGKLKGPKKTCDGRLLYLMLWVDVNLRVNEYLIDWEQLQEWYDTIDNHTFLYNVIMEKILKKIKNSIPSWHNMTEEWSFPVAVLQNQVIQIRANWHIILCTSIVLPLIMIKKD